MSELRTRQEELWWSAPRIRYLRARVLECVNRDEDWCAEGEYAFHNHPVYASGWNSMSPMGSCITVLRMFKDGWSAHWFKYLDVFRLNQVWRWGPGLPKRPFVNGKMPTDDFITGPNDPTLTALDRLIYVSRDPRRMNPAEFDQTDDSMKVHRLLCTAIDRLLQDEPEVPSIWFENGRLMVGWDPLPAEDGRLPYRHVPTLPNGRWFGTWKHNLHEWRWRAARTDLRYDGVQPDDDY